ncbi:EAL domain-containing protein, partial [Methylobacterium sp. DB0501]|uniref:EAL domain-containing protein n=1 Tax=Methylobacterium sp. DB0501 TaxID=2709665 RepID=UPI0013ECFF1B
HAMGVRISLDDFGVGFSSLARVRAFPFDRIKIDGSFVRDAVERPDCRAIVGIVSELGRRLGIETVAEGVETPAQLAVVREEGFTEAQGFLFGRPVTGQAVGRGVRRSGRREGRQAIGPVCFSSSAQASSPNLPFHSL